MARPTVEGGPAPAAKWTRNINGVVTTGTLALNTNVIRSKRTYSGSVTPGYKSMKQHARKKLTTLSHSVTYSRDIATSYYELTFGNVSNPADKYFNEYQVSDFSYIASLPSVTHLSQAYDLARARLASQVGKMKVNLAQAFAERHQTADLFASTAVRVASMARALRRGDIGALNASLSRSGRELGNLLSSKETKRILATPPSKRLANHWLELQYGWKPLLQDVYGAAELLATHVRNDPRNTTIRSSGKAKSRTRAGNGSYLNQLQEVERTTTTRFGLTYRMDSASRAGLAETGIDNPALLAWELLPYSFVVDWFLPVGNYLEALNAFAGFEFVDGFQSNSSRMQYHEVRLGNVAKSGGRYVKTTGEAWRYRSLYDRARLTSFPSVNLPSFKNPIGGEPIARFATAMSLLRVLFK